MRERPAPSLAPSDLAVGLRVYFRGQAEYPHGTIISVEESSKLHRLAFVHWDTVGDASYARGPFFADQLRREIPNGSRRMEEGLLERG